jgi:hypothetical protein
MASRPLEGLGKPIGRAYGISAAAIVAAVVAVCGGAVLVDHYDSVGRAANVQAALTARGLGPAQIKRVWKRVYWCRHAYVWRTMTDGGSACADSFSPSVVLYAPGQQPLATSPAAH